MKFASQILRSASLAAAVFLVAGAAEAADIGSSQTPREAPEQIRCEALGEGYFAVKGSTACIRISGYVSAGMGFVEPGRIAAPTTGPFAPHAFGYSTTEGAVAVDSQFDTELGPGRVYVQVGGLNFSH
jgi:hypothetical protein